MGKKTSDDQKRLETTLNEHLKIFGDGLAKNDPVYKRMNWIDAVDLYIVQKYKWFPADVRAMSTEDKAFVLTPELKV